MQNKIDNKTATETLPIESFFASLDDPATRQIFSNAYSTITFQGRLYRLYLRGNELYVIVENSENLNEYKNYIRAVCKDKNISLVFSDESPIYKHSVEANSDSSSDSLKLLEIALAEEEATLLSKPRLTNAQILQLLTRETVKREFDIYQYETANPELSNSSELLDLLNVIVDRITSETTFFEGLKDIGVLDIIKKGIPTKGTINTGGRNNANYSWQAKPAQSRFPAQFTYHKDPSAVNTTVDRIAPSFTSIIYCIASSGVFPDELNYFIEEVCHAFQYRNGMQNDIFSKIPTEAQPKRLHKRLSDLIYHRDVTSNPGSSAWLLRYHTEYMSPAHIYALVRDYTYSSIYKNLRDTPSILMSEIMDYGVANALLQVLRLPFDLTIGNKIDKNAEAQTKYIVDAYDALRALGADEVQISQLAINPGAWNGKAYLKVEAVIQRWMDTLGLNETTLQKRKRIYFLKKRVDTVKAVLIAQEEILKRLNKDVAVENTNLHHHNSFPTGSNIEFNI